MKKGLIAPRAFKNYQAGHPWLKADDIVERKTLPSRPSAAYYGDHWWFCSPESYLRLRRLGPRQDGWMKNPKLTRITNADQFGAYFGEWFHRHAAETLQRKIAALKFAAGEDLNLRWIFSENDLLPGLIVDVFGGRALVAQLLTAPIEAFWLAIKPILANAFAEVTQGKKPEIVELRSSPVRKREGLEIIAAPEMAAVTTRWNGFSWHLTPASSQKTGAYLDQRENHRRAGRYAHNYVGGVAWDICSYQGGFTLPLLAADLLVTAVDQSEFALDILRRNVGLNPPLDANKLEIAKTDAFEWLRAQKTAGRFADIIILDPPSFVKNRDALASARKGYIELNTMAFQGLKPGGMLVSCVCSHHISPEDCKKILTESAQLAGRTFTVEEFTEASPDHSPVLGFGEGRYLQAWFLKIT